MTREEAIKKLRQMTLPEETREILVALAPELAESEDDRNWKSIENAIRGFITSPIDADELLAWLEKQKEQKPHYTKRNALFDKCVENCDPKTVEEVNKRVDDIINMPELSPFEQALTNFIGYWEDDEEHWPSQFVKKHGKHILDMAREELQKEQKPELPLMSGDTDTYFDDLRITTKSLTSREWFNEGIKYAQRLQKEQHPSSRFLPDDWVVYDGPLGHAILQVKDVVGGRYSFVDNVSTLLVEDSDKFLRPLTPKDVEKKAECLKAERDGWYVCIKDFYVGGKKQCSVGDLVQAKGGMYMMGIEDISKWFRRAYYEDVRDAFGPNTDTNIPDQKPAEWSKEDEEMLTELLLTIEPSDNYDEMRNWLLLKLKSLILQGSKDSLQTHWKPSEEQMSMLLAVINDPNNAGAESCYMALKSIYNNLKKL